MKYVVAHMGARILGASAGDENLLSSKTHFQTPQFSPILCRVSRQHLIFQSFSLYRSTHWLWILSLFRHPRNCRVFGLNSHHSSQLVIYFLSLFGIFRILYYFSRLGGLTGRIRHYLYVSMRACKYLCVRRGFWSGFLFLLFFAVLILILFSLLFPLFLLGGNWVKLLIFSELYLFILSRI